MQGIQFVTTEKGKKVAVMIDLKKYGEVWEDIYDSITARMRETKPRETLAFVKKCLRQQGKRSG